MNVSEEEFKQNGASVEDMELVFEEFKLTVRLYNCIGQKIYTYDPDKKNKNITVLFGLIRGNHIYTMNDNIELSCRGRTQPRKILKCGTWLRRLWQPWFPWFSGGSQGGSQGGSPGILHAEIQRASGQIDGGMLKDCGDFIFFGESTVQDLGCLRHFLR